MAFNTNPRLADEKNFVKEKQHPEHNTEFMLIKAQIYVIYWYFINSQ